MFVVAIELSFGLVNNSLVIYKQQVLIEKIWH